MASVCLEDWDEGLLCYSPHPPHNYYYFEQDLGKFFGYAYCFFDSPQGWNLYWLAEPKLDCFLEISPDSGPAPFLAAQGQLDLGLFHRCLRAIERDDVGPAPFIRAALALPPTQFMMTLEPRLPLQHVSLFSDCSSNDSLVLTMWQRALVSEKLAMTKTGFRDNVIQVDFRRGQRD